MNGHTSVVSLLLGRSTHQLAIKDNQGRTGLHLAAAHGHLELVTLLLGQGAEVNVLDNVSEVNRIKHHLSTNSRAVYFDAYESICVNSMDHNDLFCTNNASF